MSGNPIVEEKGEDFKKEVLIALMDTVPGLQKINGDNWDPEYFAEVKAEKIQREKDAKAAVLTESDIKILELVEAMWNTFDAESSGLLDKETSFKLIVQIIANAGLITKEGHEDIFEGVFGNFDKSGAG